MKFAFTADWHLSGYSQDKIVEQLPERLFEIKTSIYNIAKYCVENEIKNMIIAGDLLHNKSLIYNLAQNILLDFFRSFQSINFVLIDGNHDLSGKGEDPVSALRVFNEPNVTRFPEMLKVKNILFVPYSSSMIDQIKHNEADILVAHFGLSEATLNSGVSIISDISIRDLIGKYKLCLLGHYHKPQEMYVGSFGLYYVGSPTQKDWGEKHEEKRFLVVDTETSRIQSILTNGYRKHFELEMTKENKSLVFESAKKILDEGNYVKIVTRDRATSWEEIAKEVNIKKRDGVSFSDKSEVDITNRGISSTMSTDDKLTKYLEVKLVPKNNWGRYKDKAKVIIGRCAEKG